MLEYAQQYEPKPDQTFSFADDIPDSTFHQCGMCPSLIVPGWFDHFTYHEKKTGKNIESKWNNAALQAYATKESHKLQLTLPMNAVNAISNSITGYEECKVYTSQHSYFGLPDLTVLRNNIEPSENILRYYLVFNDRLKLAYSGSTALKMALRLLIPDDDFGSSIKAFKEEPRYTDLRMGMDFHDRYVSELSHTQRIT